MDTGTVVRAMAGDKEAFTEIVLETQRGLLGLAMSRVHDLQAAEDIVQDAYIRAYRKLGDLRRPDRALQWLRQIVVNEASSQLRSFRSGPPGCQEAPNIDDGLSAVMSDAIRGLPQSGREAVVLVRLLGVPPGEASQLLGISRAAIDVRLSRARIAGRVSERLRSEEPREVRSIARELRLLATRANIRRLAEDLESPVPGRMREAAKAVEAIGHPGGIEPLRGLIRRTAHADVISAARRAVDALKEANASEHHDIPVSIDDLAAAGLDSILMDLSNSCDTAVVIDAFEGLGMLESGRAVPLALKALGPVRAGEAHCGQLSGFCWQAHECDAGGAPREAVVG